MFFSDNGGCAEEPGGRDPTARNPGPLDDYVAVGPAWGWAQNAPFRRYKSWLHEGGITTPCIAWWPDHVPANSINRSVAHIVDIMPHVLGVGRHDLSKVVCRASTTSTGGRQHDATPARRTTGPGQTVSMVSGQVIERSDRVIGSLFGTKAEIANGSSTIWPPTDAKSTTWHKNIRTAWLR